MFTLPSKSSFRISKPILVILLTTVGLAALLATNTMRNQSREQKILEGFLLDEGLTLIRSFEAGARTTMMHDMMGTEPPIQTLITETAKAKRIAYIVITTEKGQVIASGGEHRLAPETDLLNQLLTTKEPVTILYDTDTKEPIFEVMSLFQSLPSFQPRMMGMGHGGWNNKSAHTKLLEDGRAIIHLGLRTDEFIAAQQEDLNHSLYMGGLLLFLGSGGLYFLILYQGMLVTQMTLANMKLYTRNIIESMPDGLITLDADGYVASCNPKAFEFSGVDMNSQDTTRPEELFYDWPIHSLEMDTGNSSFPYTFSHPEEGDIPVEISASPLLDENGNKMGAVLLLRDLREIRSMEAQLARSKHLASLGRMAAGIAHEIRNPLGTLRGFAQYFGSKAEDATAKEYSELMVGEVDRLNAIISSLLQFSRPREPECTLVTLPDLLAKAGKLMEHDFSQNEIKLQLDIECQDSMDADADLLLQVLLNLLNNAINASKKGDSVNLSYTSSPEEDSLFITVRDSGIGMNQEEREKMFDPFFTTRKAGTGLGLAISHQIVEQHHGTFDVQSEPGKGTEITIIFPRQTDTSTQKELSDEKNTHS
jgi:two-component system sensor histidine kinase HydH